MSSTYGKAGAMTHGFQNALVCSDVLMRKKNGKKMNNIWLVVEPYPSEIYEFVSLDDYSQYMGQ